RADSPYLKSLASTLPENAARKRRIGTNSKTMKVRNASAPIGNRIWSCIECPPFECALFRGDVLVFVFGHADMFRRQRRAPQDHVGGFLRDHDGGRVG